MHGLLFGFAVSSAVVLRMLWHWSLSDRSGTGDRGSWNQRWIAAMFSFVLPPLLLLTSARASIRQLQRYPVQGWAALGLRARLLPLDVPFIAQVGLWNPEIVISQGLLTQLDADHLKAVIAHEQAHAQYHDTVWFSVLAGCGD